MNIKALALPKDNWRNVLESSALVALAAGLTYVVENGASIDLGSYTPVVVAVATVALTYVKKVIENR